MQHKLSESRRGKTDVFGLILCAVVVAAVIFVWVSWKGSNRGTIAILRMEDVARQIGFDVEAEKIFNREKTIMQADVARQRELLQTDIGAKREEYGENATPEQQEILLAMEQQMQAQSKQLQRRAQEGLQQVRSKQLQEFRREIGPVIMKLQATYGFTIVLDPTMSGGIVFVDPATDITDAVVQELQHQSQDTTVNGPAGTASEMPSGFPSGGPVAP